MYKRQISHHLNLVEGRVRRALAALKQCVSCKKTWPGKCVCARALDEDEFVDAEEQVEQLFYTITDDEQKEANTQASSIAQHIPLAKIHKDNFPTASGELCEQTHGDGAPRPTFLSALKFRFVNPMRHAPTAKLGQLINEILKPIQNSGARTESIQEIVVDIQKINSSGPSRRR